MRQVRLVLRDRPRQRQAAVPLRRGGAARQYLSAGDLPPQACAYRRAAAVPSASLRCPTIRRRCRLRRGPACAGRPDPREHSQRARRPCLFKTVSKPVPPAETWGTLTALDLTKGGRVLWQAKTPQPLVGGTLATAGGLVFTGEPNGRFAPTTPRPAPCCGAQRPEPGSARRRCPTWRRDGSMWPSLPAGPRRTSDTAGRSIRVFALPAP